MSDKDDNLEIGSSVIVAEIIRSDSDLFDNLKRIATDDDDQNKNIACIDFIYPLTIYVFDADDELIFVNLVGDDDEFTQLLNSLDIENSISLSFPIASTLASGEEFIINNKEELFESINNCLEDELINEFNGFSESCVLKVGYSYNDINPYLGIIFNPINGQVNIAIDGVIHSGSWSPFTIEQELHININLIDDTEIADYFNSDWKITYSEDNFNSLILQSDDREIIMNRRCDNDIFNCTNFIFEVCENILDSKVSDFILNDYTECIFDTLLLDENLEISYHETEEDAINNLNAIVPTDIYNNTEEVQDIFIRIYDAENETYYYPIINLKSISC